MWVSTPEPCSICSRRTPKIVPVAPVMPTINRVGFASFIIHFTCNANCWFAFTSRPPVLLDQLPFPISLREHDPAVIVVMMRIIIVMMVQFSSHLRGLRLSQFVFETLLDRRVFAIGFDLFDL